MVGNRKLEIGVIAIITLYNSILAGMGKKIKGSILYFGRIVYLSTTPSSSAGQADYGYYLSTTPSSSTGPADIRIIAIIEYEGNY
jgi:hypothetical protein